MSDCSDKISREHYISEYLLNNLSNSKVVSMSGLNWHKSKGPINIAKTALVTNVLCEKHNGMLSPFDKAMGRLHQKIAQYDKGLIEDDFQNQFSLFSGEDIERWLLKTTCAYIASDQIYVGAEKFHFDIDPIFLDILYKGRDFPEGWGLYCDSNAEKFLHHQYLQVNFGISGGELRYVKFVLNGVTMYLLLSRPNSVANGMIHRPRGFEFRKGNNRKLIEFSWPNPQHNNGLFFNQNRVVSKTPAEWQEWVHDKK